jgi:hemoglobin
MKVILTLFASAALAMAFAGGGRADDAKDSLSRRELDNRLYNSLLEITKQGVQLYNERGDEAGCYRLFQAALKLATPLLDHRPELQKTVTEQMKKADGLPGVREKAFALRTGLDEILKALHGPEAAPKPKTTEPKITATGGKSLWDRLGGEPAVRAVVKEFIVVAAKDPKVNVTRDGKYKLDEKATAKLEQLVVELISQVSGGPLKYSGRDMKTAHASMKITEAEFNAAAGHLIAVLKQFKVPQKEIDELVGIVATTKKDIVEKK